MLASVVFVCVVTGIGYLDGRWAIAVYALSFWHYLIYALAYRFRAVALPVFKRDAVLMKSVALLAVAPFYLAAGPEALSLVVVALGFLLNISAAAALGSDRTYYGHELAGLPATWVTGFPYSVTAHPMLIGNMVAFGGLLLDAEFRQDWWPLAVLHVALNLAVLLMEVHAMPRPQRRPAAGDWRSRLCSWPAGAGLLAVGALVALVAASGPLTAFGVALCALAYGCVLFGLYAWPPSPSAVFGSAQEEIA